MEDRYIGDGVYASHDGYHVVLDFRAQDEYTKIALDPLVIEQLLTFIKDVAAEKLRIAKEKVNHG